MQFKLIQKQEFDKVRNFNCDKVQKLELFTTMCRFNTFTAVKKAGSGHLGSSFSAADLITFLYLEHTNILEKGINSPDRDIYFSSKGHDVPGLYSLFYAVGILEEDKLLSLRRLNGVDGHPEVKIPGIESSTGSLGMGISKGKGMAWAKNYSGNGGRIFVLTGDGEFQEGQIYESLQATAHQKINNITVIVDHNKYQTDMLVEDVNNIEDLQEKVSAFGWAVFRCNGHSFSEIQTALIESEKITDKPKLIIADTIKGKGLSFMQQTCSDSDGKQYYKWHSGAPDDINFKTGLAELSKKILQQSQSLGLSIEIPKMDIESTIASKIEKEFVTVAYGEALVELAKSNEKFVVLDGDLSADCKLRPFEFSYPHRFIENGIAEQDMVSMAGGLAHLGLLPIVNTFGSFLSSRANEQIYNNSTEKKKVIYTCHFSGLIPAGPGKSHQSVRDISLFGAIPNLTILQPCNAVETKLVTDYCINTADENCMIRLAIGPSPRRIILPEKYALSIGRGIELTRGDDTIIFGYGPVLLHEALTASEYLASIEYGLKVVNMPWLNKVDDNWLANIVENYSKIFVLEDHSNYGGLGDRLLNSLVKTHSLGSREFHKIGLDDYPECGTPQEVLQFHGLDGKSIAKRVSDISNLDELLEGALKEMLYTTDAPQ